MIKLYSRKLLLGAGMVFFLSQLIWTEVSWGEIRMAVAPFQLEYSQEKEIIRCVFCGNLMPGGLIEGNPSDPLTHLLWNLLQKKNKGFDFIDPGQVSGIYNIILAKKVQGNTLQLMETIGRQLKVDYMLWGAVFRFQERKGTAYAVEKPASVSFDLHLLRIKDGKLVWRVQYAKTQQSLTENLLEMENLLKQNMRWVSAQELSSFGLEELLKEFPSAETLK